MVYFGRKVYRVVLGQVLADGELMDIVAHSAVISPGPFIFLESI